MISSIAATFKDGCLRGDAENYPDLDYPSIYFSNGFLSTIYEWPKKEDRTPEQIAEFL